MTDPATRNHNVLLEMRALAEQGIEQARNAFDELMTATHRAVSSFEGQTTAAQAAARDLQQQAMGFAQRNIAASFEFAQSLVRARSPEEIAKLHADFVTAQMQALTGQAQEPAQNARNAASRSQKGAA
jgi:phasin